MIGTKLTDYALKIEDGKGWAFLNGEWTTGPEQELVPPETKSIMHGAFWSGHAFIDFSVEFQVRFGFPEAGGARFFFRAQDATRYYAFDLPFNGTQVRAKHAWGVISKGDGGGLDQYLQLSLIPRVVAEFERWYSVRVEASGDELRVWVDGEALPPVRDSSFHSGRIGIGSFGGPAVFRNLTVSGQPYECGEWPEELSVPDLLFFPWYTSDSNKQVQGLAQIRKTADGELLCVFPAGAGEGAPGSIYFSHSTDGRKWTTPQAVPHQTGRNAFGIWAEADGRVIFHSIKENNLLRHESSDNGHTWQSPVSVPVEVPDTLSSVHGYGPISELPDGCLVMFFYGPVKHHWGDEEWSGPKGHIATWGNSAWQAFCLRSSDGGRTWNKPVNMDRVNMPRTEPGEIAGSYDLTETAGGWIEGDRCMALIRPAYSPWMWESWSEDSGKTWGPTKIGPFPGYAPSFLRLESGALLVTHRYPYLTAHVSSDGGRTWSTGTRIEWKTGAMTAMVEMEPGRVLIVSHGGGYHDSLPLLRGQFVRVEPDGIFAG